MGNVLNTFYQKMLVFFSLLKFLNLNEIKRARKFPSLVNCCDIDWFQDWPEDTLEKVAQSFLSKTYIEEKDRKVCVDICKYFHVSSANLSQK